MFEEDVNSFISLIEKSEETKKIVKIGNWNVCMGDPLPTPAAFGKFKTEILSRIPSYYEGIIKATGSEMPKFYQSLSSSLEEKARHLIEIEEKGRSLYPPMIHIDTGIDFQDGKFYLFEVDGDSTGLSLLSNTFGRKKIEDVLKGKIFYLPRKQRQKYSVDLSITGRPVVETGELGTEKEGCVLWRYGMTLDAIDDGVIEITQEAIDQGIPVAPNPLLLSKIWLTHLRTLRDFVPSTIFLPLTEKEKRKELLDIPTRERKDFIIKSNSGGGGRSLMEADRFTTEQWNRKILLEEGRGSILQKKINNIVGNKRAIFMTFAFLKKDNTYEEVGTLLILRPSIRVHGGSDSVIFPLC